MADKTKNIQPDNTIIITEEEIKYVRSLIGNEFPVNQSNETATKDIIRHYADGIGDPNPLWRDKKYASNTQYGCIIAPPTFLNAIVPATWDVAFPGLKGYVAGFEWEYSKIIKENDTFRVTNYFEDMQIKKSGMSGSRLFIQYGRFKYYNQNEELIGICRWSNIRPESSLPVDPYVRQKYTDDQLDAIDKAYLNEKIRGAELLFWEDVNIGDQIPPVVKGPITPMDVVAFLMGIGWQGQAHGLSPIRKDRSRGWQDPETNVIEPRVEVHFSDKVARGQNSIPYAYDLGVQRLGWVGHMITNWIGDDGFISKLSLQIRRINYLGSTVWCKGKVVNKYNDREKCCIDCKVWCENQNGEVIAPGLVTVNLLSKNK